jgi:hypothetical protein
MQPVAGREPSSVMRPKSVWKPTITTGPACRLSGARTRRGRLHVPVADTMTRVLEPCLGTKHVAHPLDHSEQIGSAVRSLQAGGPKARSFPNPPDRKLETATPHSLYNRIGSWKRSVGDRGRSAGTIRGDARQPRQRKQPEHAAARHHAGDATTSRGPRQPEFVRVVSEREAAARRTRPLRRLRPCLYLQWVEDMAESLILPEIAPSLDPRSRCLALRAAF